MHPVLGYTIISKEAVPKTQTSRAQTIATLVIVMVMAVVVLALKVMQHVPLLQRVAERHAHRLAV